jgi:hypothetical protein
MIMVCGSLAELFIHYKVIWLGFKSVFRASNAGLDSFAKKRGKTVAFFEKHGSGERSVDLVEDPARPEDQVKSWMWMLGLLVTLVVSFIICALQWVSYQRSLTLEFD